MFCLLLLFPSYYFSNICTFFLFSYLWSQLFSNHQIFILFFKYIFNSFHSAFIFINPFFPWTFLWLTLLLFFYLLHHIFMVSFYCYKYLACFIPRTHTRSIFTNLCQNGLHFPLTFPFSSSPLI